MFLSHWRTSLVTSVSYRMTGTEKLMIRKFFFCYIGKSNEHCNTWEFFLPCRRVDLVGPDHVTTFSVPKLSRGRSSAKFCRSDDCVLSRIVALSKTRLHRNVLKYRNGSELPLEDKKYIYNKWKLDFPPRDLVATSASSYIDTRWNTQMKQARNRIIN